MLTEFDGAVDGEGGEYIPVLCVGALCMRAGREDREEVVIVEVGFEVEEAELIEAEDDEV